MIVDIPIEPMGKPRMTRRDVWAEREVVLRYRAFCDQLRLSMGQYDLPDTFDIEFFLPMPLSWNKKKREAHRGRPHQGKPDLDNLLKAVMDALRKDDASIWKVSAAKYWQDKGSITINGLLHLPQKPVGHGVKSR